MANFLKNKYLIGIIYALFVFCSCSTNDDSNAEVNQEDDPIAITPNEDLPQGTGVFNYTYNALNWSKILKVYYYSPQNRTPTTPIVFVFHGTGRNAKDYRDAMISKADQYGFLVIAPEFSEQNFPGGDGYNLGNVFVDGDHPSPTTLNPEAEWTFSIIEPLFDLVKTVTDNTNATYNVFGHSAGGQFTHRFIMFKPNARVNKVVSSGSGWFTFPDASITFPYGFNQSPLEEISLETLLSRNITIQVGAQDTDPNSPGLRHNEFADAQGLNRKDRAINFYAFCEDLAQSNTLSFNWDFHIIENTGHDYVKASKEAADLIFN